MGAAAAKAKKAAAAKAKEAAAAKAKKAAAARARKAASDARAKKVADARARKAASDARAKKVADAKALADKKAADAKAKKVAEAKVLADAKAKKAVEAKTTDCIVLRLQDAPAPSHCDMKAIIRSQIKTFPCMEKLTKALQIDLEKQAGDEIKEVGAKATKMAEEVAIAARKKQEADAKLKIARDRALDLMIKEKNFGNYDARTH